MDAKPVAVQPLAPAHTPTPSSPRCWIAVASAEHVRLGRAQGFMQVCHGKAAPLRRLRAGDRVAYYSPSRQFGGKDKLQSFTALGRVLERPPYAFDMGGGFVPFRRDVVWQEVRVAPIQPLLDRLAFSRGQKTWGYQLRFGLFEVSAQDMDLIAEAMAAAVNGPFASMAGRHTGFG
ncbi:EVE domain-containing protein [Paucibacter sp. KCTC 42545]|uniref:EVE domain-containing protein n=1 Tax=Paucibacter sp. KCTC 42545 TaxID=1768242 RepID=UPI0009E9466A|nr:EVE domain-containing protein [Paucibacter sp. KCTC 42545]